VASRVGVAHVRKSSSGAVAVLLEDNSLLMLGRTRGVVNRVRLARPSAQPMGGRYLARTRSGNLVAVAPGRKKDVLAIVNARGRVIRRVTLPSGIHFRAIELGASTGRVFLGGEITTTRATKFGTLAKTAVLTVMSLSGQGFATTKLRRPDGHGSRLGPLDWSIYDIAVSRDEQRVYVSYHGSNTDGADWIDVGRDVSTRCLSSSEPACPRRSGSRALSGSTDRSTRTSQGCSRVSGHLPCSRGSPRRAERLECGEVDSKMRISWSSLVGDLSSSRSKAA
jgi:hypothetical protein